MERGTVLEVTGAQKDELRVAEKAAKKEAHPVTKKSREIQQKKEQKKITIRAGTVPKVSPQKKAKGRKKKGG